MAAHNEEKIISKSLNSLLNLPYDNYEVLIGLDGCTDNTERIVNKFVNKSKKFKYYKFNLRNGKPPVINSLIKKAKGEIIMINDADWEFWAKDGKTFLRFIKVVENPLIGGIAEAFHLEWNEKKIENGNMWYRMIAYS